MKAIPFPQANKVLKAPPSPRDEVQALIDKLAAEGADMSEAQAKLDAALPPERGVYDLPVWGGAVEGAERCISCWEPTLEEREQIAAGGPVWLWVYGFTHPPVVLDAKNPFEVRQQVEGWPFGISDGLTLSCHDCGAIPAFDYTVKDEFWNRWVPGPERLGVLCLPCLDRRCGGAGLDEALEKVQWTGTGHTVVLAPVTRHKYETVARELRRVP